MRTFPLDAEFHDGETLGSIGALLALDEEYRVSTYSYDAPRNVTFTLRAQF